MSKTSPTPILPLPVTESILKEIEKISTEHKVDDHTKMLMEMAAFKAAGIVAEGDGWAK